MKRLPVVLWFFSSLLLSYEHFITDTEKAGGPIWDSGNMFEPTTFWFHDLVIATTSPYIGGMSAFFITNLERPEANIYRAECVADVMHFYSAQIAPIAARNLEDISTGEKYVLYIQHNNNRVRIYLNGEEAPRWELMKVSARFIEIFGGFPYKGQWPGEQDYKSYLAPDIFEPWPALPLSDLKNVIDKKPVTTISHTLTSNLRLRAKPGTSSAVVDTLQEGSGVYMLQTGNTATIDGITAPWVYVAAQNGRQGWCFSGYLEEAGREPQAPPEAAQPDAAPEAETGEGGGVPYAALAAGAVALAGVCAALALRRKKKA
jgi:hypothetical protein